MTMRISKDRIDLDNKVLQKPVFKDYAETVVTDNSSTSYTIDLTQGNVFDITLTGNCSFTFSNPPASGTAGNFTLLLHQDGTGSRTVTWPSAVKWLSGSEPTLATDANTADLLIFSTIDGGTTWYSTLAGGAYPAPPSAPSAPTSLSATPGNAEVDLSWSTPGDDGGSSITGYKIYRDTSTSATTLIDTIGVTTSYNDDSVTNDTTYYYRVKAVNGIGDSDYSNEDSVMPVGIVSDSISVSIANDADDGCYIELEGGWDDDEIYQGSIGGFAPIEAGFRFRSGVTIPQGAIILSATLSVARESASGTSFGTMYGYDADNPAVWSSSNHPLNMPQTTASITIANNGSTTTMDVTNIVQEIVNRGGWSSGNAMSFGGDDSGDDSIQWVENTATLDVDFEYIP